MKKKTKTKKQILINLKVFHNVFSSTNVKQFFTIATQNISPLDSCIVLFITFFLRFFPRFLFLSSHLITVSTPIPYSLIPYSLIPSPLETTDVPTCSHQNPSPASSNLSPNTSIFSITVSSAIRKSRNYRCC